MSVCCVPTPGPSGGGVNVGYVVEVAALQGLWTRWRAL